MEELVCSEYIMLLTLSFLSLLFMPYSFRQVYREEKQSVSPDDVQPECAEPPSSGRRRISRVVVEHNDSHETFYDNFSRTLQQGGASDDFFDSDSFWSGSITWY